MNDVFNTTFELALRILLTLEVSTPVRHSLDMISALDFLTVYGRDFGLAERNLHGDNNYKYSEIALRRKLVQQGIRLLVCEDLIQPFAAPAGFLYGLNSQGLAYCAKLQSTYAQTYRTLARSANNYTRGKTERNVLSEINRHSIHALKRGDPHE